MKQLAMTSFERATHRWTYHMMAQSQMTQEERIAEHYASLAHMSMYLRKLIELRKQDCTTDLNDTIRYLTEKIRERHLMDFGIQLEWTVEEHYTTTKPE